MAKYVVYSKWRKIAGDKKKHLLEIRYGQQVIAAPVVADLKIKQNPTKNEEKFNVSTKEIGQKYADRMLKILEDGLEVEDLKKLLEQGITFEEIEKQLSAGMEGVQIRKNADRKNMPLAVFVQHEVEKQSRKEYHKDETGTPIAKKKTFETSAAGYTRAFSAFFRSLGKYTSSSKISWQEVERFIEKAKDTNWDIREDKENTIHQFIIEQKHKFKNQEILDFRDLDVFFKKHGIKLSIDPKRADKPFFREKEICNRIQQQFYYEIGSKLLCKEVTQEHVDNFYKFLTLDSRLKSAQKYYTDVKTKLKILESKHIFLEDIEFERFRRKNVLSDKNREDLTEEERNILFTHPWQPTFSQKHQKTFDYTKPRLAFLFACLTGLRYSDIIRIKWKNIGSDNYLRIAMQKKTEQPANIPLDAVVYEILDGVAKLDEVVDREKSQDEYIFKFDMTKKAIAENLSKWVRSAGIHKHITFHSARHTLCSILIRNGVDGYIVSDILGHIDDTMIRTYIHIHHPQRVAAIEKLYSERGRPIFRL